jgi:hypothetical protein
MKADVTKSTLRRARLSGSTFCLFVQNDKKEDALSIRKEQMMTER